MRWSSDKNSSIKLEEALRALDKPTIPVLSQDKLRVKLMRKISSVRREREISEMLPWFYLLVRAIKKIGRETVPSSSMRVLLREKILAILPQRRSFSFVFLRIFSARAVSFALLVIFAGAVFFNFLNSPETVSAAPITYIEAFEGQVEITRGGRSLQAKPKMSLRAKDVIRTNEGSSATIHFLDDSLGRLSGGSELYIERLFVNPADPTKTIVELQLKKGRLWAKVLSLVDEFSKFQVRGNEAVAVATKKATFDVMIDEKGKTKIAAVSNSVDVKVPKSKANETMLSTAIVNGYAVEIEKGEARVTKRETGHDHKQDIWMAENLAADQQYVVQITERNRETRLTSIPGFNPLQSITEKTAGVFRSDFEKEKARLKAAEAKLVQAELLLEKNSHEEAEELLNGFNELSSETASKIKELEASDPEEAAMLKDAYEAQMRLYKKQFTLFLPDDSQYALKSVVENAEMALASTPAERTKRTLDVAAEKLLETQQLAQSGKSELVATSLEQYTKTLEDASAAAAQASGEEKSEIVSAMLEKKTDHLIMLQALAKDVEFKAPPVLAPTEQRGISLEEVLGKAVQASLPAVSQAVSDSADEEPTEEVLQKLEEIQQVEVNGKPVVDVKMTSDKVVIQADLELPASPGEGPALNRPSTGSGQAVEGPPATEIQKPQVDANVEIQPAQETKAVLKKPETPQEIKTDPISGITVINIEAKPSGTSQ